MARERLGLAVIPGAGWSARDIQDVAREADAAGFDAIFSTEVNNDRAGHGPTYGLRNRAHAVVVKQLRRRGHGAAAALSGRRTTR
jgi:hypothetical protein